MPPKRRTELGRRTRKAEKQRSMRANRNNEQYEARNDLPRIRKHSTNIKINPHSPTSSYNVPIDYSLGQNVAFGPMGIVCPVCKALKKLLHQNYAKWVNPSTSTTGEEFHDSSDLSSATEDERTNADAVTSFSVDLDQSRQSEVETNKGNVTCPKCGADFNVESREQENVNAIVARVYAYFAIESTGLSSAQLRQRTAALTGVSEADVQRALDQNPQKLQDTDEPHSKRRRIKEEPDEEPAVCVKLESDENKSDGEKDPLAPDVDMKPDVTETHSTHPSHLMVSEGIKREITEFEDGFR